MKKYISILFLLLPMQLTSAFTEIQIEREYYKSWVVFKVNDDELYVAKKIRNQNVPYFFAFKPSSSSGNPLNTTEAQKLWEDINDCYTTMYGNDAGNDETEK